MVMYSGGKLLNSLKVSLQKAETCILTAIFGRPFPPPAICMDSYNLPATSETSKFSLKDIIGDGFLYAVPKSRKTIEKRLTKMFGNPKYVWKMLVPKTYLLVCNTCGHHYEAKKLCPNCYEKIKQETTEMQEKIKSELGLDPVDTEVVVLYEGEKLEEPEEFWYGKRVVEMKKPRPSWFSKNLLQKSTQQPATSTDIKPTDLA